MWGGQEPGAREKYAAKWEREKEEKANEEKKIWLKKKKGPKCATYIHGGIIQPYKGMKFFIPAAAEINLEDTTLSEISQTQNDK